MIHTRVYNVGWARIQNNGPRRHRWYRIIDCKIGANGRRCISKDIKHTHTPKGITKKEERVCFIYKRIWAPAFEIQKATMTNKWGHTFRTWIEKKWTNTAHNSLGIFQKIKHQIQIHHWAFQNCHSPGLFNKTSILPVWPLEMLQCPWYTITPECPFKNWIGQVVTFHYYCCILFV